MNRRTLIASILSLLILSFTVVGIGYRFFYVPLSSQTQSTIYTLSKGTSVKTMIRQMKQKGIVSSVQGFLLARWIRWEGVERQLKAGEYAIPLNITPEKLVNKLIKGDVVQHAITFSEGITFKEALKLLQSHPGMNPNPAFDPKAMMLTLGEPSLEPEGIFFPSTYFFPRGTPEESVFKVARKTMQQHLEKAYRERSEKCILQSPYEVLILASIIEKESALVAERPVISGVFQRRLAKDMLLQADPTLIYGLRDQLSGSENPFSGRLTYAHLKQDFSYNTYVRKGLPPTPIALPSLNAIYAACNPDESVALYFVAKGDGSHVFSATLEAHQDAVKKYRPKSNAGTNDPSHDAAVSNAGTNAPSHDTAGVAK